MAGFQQAANAITGSFGTVGGKVGVYNELVGKNKEQREQLAKQNEELDKQNKELEEKNKEITEKTETIKSQYRDLYNKTKELVNKNKIINVQDELRTLYHEENMSQSQQIDALRSRLSANIRARASRDFMLDVVYGEKPATTAVSNVKSKEGGK